MRDGPSPGRTMLDDDREAAWRRYRDNVARHLIGIARDLQSRVLRRLADDHGYEGLRPSLGRFLSLIWTEGRPLSALAEQLAISKQACSQLAMLAERAGYLEREQDPGPPRTQRVLLSPHGRALVEDAVRLILEAESEYADRIGADRYRRFTSSSAALFVGLGIQPHANPTLHAAASRSIGVLPLIALRIEERLMEATRARGHRGLKMSHAQILPLVGPEGARIREIARIHRVSRQAISATARDLESLGYLRREPDPEDARGVRLRLTARGERLIRVSIDSLDALEASFRSVLGARRLAELQRVAADLYGALRLEVEIFGAEGRPGGTAVAAGAPAAPAAEAELRDLAAVLQRRLGVRDAKQLGRLLSTGETVSTP